MTINNILDNINAQDIKVDIGNDGSAATLLIESCKGFYQHFFCDGIKDNDLEQLAACIVEYIEDPDSLPCWEGNQYDDEDHNNDFSYETAINLDDLFEDEHSFQSPCIKSFILAKLGG